MIKLICDKLTRIIQNKARLERDLDVKITNQGREVSIDGEPENEFVAEKVILALNVGFPYSISLTLSEEGTILEIMNIKDYTKRKDFERIKSRIIGTKGKTLRTLSSLTRCYFEVKDKEIGIIGDPEYIKNAHEAILFLIKGSKQGNVYAYLEKHQIKPESDLGLKEAKK
jgi:ribosomal RNA assembly protein